MKCRFSLGCGYDVTLRAGLTYRFIDVLTGRVAELDLDIADHRNDLLHYIGAAINQLDKVLAGLPIQPDEPKADSE